MGITVTGNTPLRPLPEGSRYELLLRIASGGMATVYLGRLKASAGFWKLRAIKRAHPHLVEDGELRQHMIAEARLCSKIDHPNVVAMQDVEELQGELLLIMDYIEGGAVIDFLRSHAEIRKPVPPAIGVRMVLDAAAGLAAAHALTDEDGVPLELVHRDVSPQNILVGVDGVCKMADFGIAKCMQSSAMVRTTTGGLKGKVGYMSPEYVKGRGLDARSDVFALGVVLWELLCGRRLFRGSNELVTLQQVASTAAPRVSEFQPKIGRRIEEVVACALNKSPAARYPSMDVFGAALQTAAEGDDLLGKHSDVKQLLEQLFGARLQRRRAMIKKAIAEQAASSEDDWVPLDQMDRTESYEDTPVGGTAVLEMPTHPQDSTQIHIEDSTQLHSFPVDESTTPEDRGSTSGNQPAVTLALEQDSARATQVLEAVPGDMPAFPVGYTERTPPSQLVNAVRRQQPSAPEPMPPMRPPAPVMTTANGMAIGTFPPEARSSWQRWAAAGVVAMVLILGVVGIAVSSSDSSASSAPGPATSGDNAAAPKPTAKAPDYLNGDPAGNSSNHSEPPVGTSEPAPPPASAKLPSKPASKPAPARPRPLARPRPRPRPLTPPRPLPPPPPVKRPDPNPY